MSRRDSVKATGSALEILSENRVQRKHDINGEDRHRHHDQGPQEEQPGFSLEDGDVSHGSDSHSSLGGGISRNLSSEA